MYDVSAFQTNAIPSYNTLTYVRVLVAGDSQAFAKHVAAGDAEASTSAVKSSQARENAWADLLPTIKHQHHLRKRVWQRLGKLYSPGSHNIIVLPPTE